MKSILILVCIIVSTSLYGQQSSSVDVFDQNPMLEANIPNETKIYPNPIVDIFRIDLREFTGSSAFVQIFNDKNQQIYAYKMDKVDSHYLQLSAYAIGMIEGEFNIVLEGPKSKSSKKVTLH